VNGFGRKDGEFWLGELNCSFVFPSSLADINHCSTNNVFVPISFYVIFE